MKYSNNKTESNGHIVERISHPRGSGEHLKHSTRKEKAENKHKQK